MTKTFISNGHLLGLPYGQWGLLFLLIFSGIVVDFIVRHLVRTYFKRVTKRHNGKISPEILRQTVKPAGLFFAALLWVIVFPLIKLPDLGEVIIHSAVQLFAILTGAWTFWSLVDIVSEFILSKAEKTENKFDDVLYPLLKKTAKIFIAVMAFIYGAQSLNIPIKPFLASLGIGGLAFAFAAKDTIANLFGSLAVVLDRPFCVGDWVTVGEIDGTVESVGFRSTRIRTFYDAETTVPNSKLVNAEIVNHGRRRYRRFKCHIGVQYNTLPDKISAFTQGIREIIQSHPKTRKDNFHVNLNQFAPSSLDILLYVFWETPDWTTELQERERLLLDIIRLAEKLDIQFAFPTQTIHLSR